MTVRDFLRFSLPARDDLLEGRLIRPHHPAHILIALA